MTPSQESDVNVEVPISVLLKLAEDTPGSCLYVRDDRVELWLNERSGDCFIGTWTPASKIWQAIS